MNSAGPYMAGVLQAVCIVMSVAVQAAGGAVVGTTAVTVDATPIETTQCISGHVDASTSQAGDLEVTVDWVDNYGRIADRCVSTIHLPGTTRVTFSLPAQAGLTMLNRLVVSARFPATGDTLSPSSADWELIPEAMDHEDYHANVWGDGATSDPAYFASLAGANVDLGHIYREATANQGYSFAGATFFGPLYNVRPNQDFMEDKRWFEMTDGMHDARYSIYSAALAAGTYYDPNVRRVLTRAQSLSSASSLASLVSIVSGRMQATRKWRPLQWNIGDEYGLGRRDYPFDYDLGADCINQFIAWLQGQYGTIEALNGQWGTHFSAWSELADPIHAPRYGEAALIITQEMADREFPLYADATGAKNFSPWSDFRRHMELIMANAMQRCVDAGRAIDPAVPVGWEGGETVEPLNGYDYWLQMRLMGSFEAYDLSNSPEYARSFRVNKYGEKLFRWITVFNSGSSIQDRYHLWFDLIHYGQRGSVIWWNEDFFHYPTSYDLTSYAQGLAPAYREFREGLAKLLSQGEPDDGQIALYYSQRSQHVSWMYDNEPGGKRWLPVMGAGQHQPSDRRLVTSHYNETGWLKALEDIGLKGRFVSYEQVANGELILQGYKVLIMPRVLAMSAEEIAAVQAFAQAGGVVIADSQTAIYDGHCKRRSIGEGGGLMDSWFGIQRSNYRSTERTAGSGDAYSGSVVLQTPPAGFEALIEGLDGSASSGFHAVEDGVGVADGTAMGLLGGEQSKPVLIVKNHGAGKSVYMNLTLMRYGRGGSNYVEQRRDPSSAAARAVRQLVGNLMALADVTPAVRVLQGTNAADGAPEVYNLEKARLVDGEITYLGCVVNSQLESQDWSATLGVAGTLFGQTGVTSADVTLIVDQPCHVYDVRQRTYLGYGTRLNARQPVYEGGVFALLPYRVMSLHVDSLTFDAKQRATVQVSVRPDGLRARGRHVFHVSVANADGSEVMLLTRNVVAAGGVWRDVVPFAISDDLTGWRIRIRDVASGVGVDVPVGPVRMGDVNSDGAVNVWDLIGLVTAWGSSRNGDGYSEAADINSDGYVNVGDLQLLVAGWG